jgi:hypothetical protein
MTQHARAAASASVAAATGEAARARDTAGSRAAALAFSGAGEPGRTAASAADLRARPGLEQIAAAATDRERAAGNDDRGES